VTPGPGDQTGAGRAGRGRLRASHADRDQVIGVLKAGFVQGLLTKDEFDARVAQTFTSRTYAELAAVTADIPTGLIGAQPPRKPARARAQPPVNIPVIIGLTVLTAGLWATALFAHFDNDFDIQAVVILVFSFTFAWLGFLIISGLTMLESRHEKRSRGQQPGPPAPSAGGQRFQRTASAAEAEQLPQINHAPRHTAEAARSHLPRPQLSSSRPPHQWRPCGRRYAIGYADH
jgi:hypothetical protein